MKNVVYLAVNENGEELASNTPLYRKSYLMAKAYGEKRAREYLEGKLGTWHNVYKIEQYASAPTIEFRGATLPKGTIEILTGIKMTWKDEPISLSL